MNAFFDPIHACLSLAGFPNMLITKNYFERLQHKRFCKIGYFNYYEVSITTSTVNQ